MDSIRTAEVPRGPRRDSFWNRRRRHRPTTAYPARRGVGVGTRPSGRKATIQESGPPRCRRPSTELSILFEGQEDGCLGDLEQHGPRPRMPTSFLQATIPGTQPAAIRVGRQCPEQCPQSCTGTEGRRCCRRRSATRQVTTEARWVGRYCQSRRQFPLAQSGAPDARFLESRPYGQLDIRSSGGDQSA